jgi:hypothetical protein
MVSIGIEVRIKREKEEADYLVLMIIKLNQSTRRPKPRKQRRTPHSAPRSDAGTPPTSAKTGQDLDTCML